MRRSMTSSWTSVSISPFSQDSCVSQEIRADFAGILQGHRPTVLPHIKTSAQDQTMAAFTPWDNPMGTNGFEFIEFAAPDPAALGKLFVTMGFTAVAKHRHKNVTLYRQGRVNFIINAETDAFAQRFARLQGPSICAIAFRVKDE